VAAIDQKKQRILVHEADAFKGGAGLEELRMELTNVSHRIAIFSDDKSVIKWFRLVDFQLQSLQLIVQQMLMSTPKYRNKTEPLELYIPGSILDKPLAFPHQVVLYASRHNPGAAEAAEELRVTYNQVRWTDTPPLSFQMSQSQRRLKLPARQKRYTSSSRRSQQEDTPPSDRLSNVHPTTGAALAPGASTRELVPAITGPPHASQRTSSADHSDPATPLASHFLLYLNRHTYCGPEGASLETEIKKAWAAKLKIVLLHEKDNARGGCEFETFLLTTAQCLIEEGLYRRQLATPFEGDETHRKVSRALFAKALGGKVSSGMGMSRMRSHLVREGASSAPTTPSSKSRVQSILQRESLPSSPRTLHGVGV